MEGKKSDGKTNAGSKKAKRMLGSNVLVRLCAAVILLSPTLSAWISLAASDSGSLLMNLLHAEIRLDDKERRKIIT